MYSHIYIICATVNYTQLNLRPALVPAVKILSSSGEISSMATDAFVNKCIPSSLICAFMSSTFADNAFNFPNSIMGSWCLIAFGIVALLWVKLWVKQQIWAIIHIFLIITITLGLLCQCGNEEFWNANGLLQGFGEYQQGNLDLSWQYCKRSEHSIASNSCVSRQYNVSTYMYIGNSQETISVWPKTATGVELYISKSKWVFFVYFILPIFLII